MAWEGMLQASWGPAGPLQATVGAVSGETERVPENSIFVNSWVEKDYVTTKAFRGLGEGRLKFFPVLGSFSRAGFNFYPVRLTTHCSPFLPWRKTYI